MFLPMYHATVIAVNSYTIWYDQKYMEIPFPAEGYKEVPLRARIAFCTFWCLYLQTFYFILSLLNDVFGTNDASPRKKPFIRTFKDHIFSLAFPVALNVTITFWTVYFYKKELVFPDYVANVVPFWGNMVLHVTNSVFILIEVFVSRITYPTRPVGLALALVFNVSYLYCLVTLRLRTGAWIYPLLELFDVPTTAVCFVITMLLGLSLYVLGEKLSSVPNVKQVNGINGSIKKKY
ncbi:hypothetical protein ABMA27_013054 [Loxostege sticticalis]|uniref:Androgen-dependent TFPI-regulating protein n=1 Tax=Loxostege sticticalis TaxID=481309 RepID=A0ABR3IDX1_LOXSC